MTILGHDRWDVFELRSMLRIVESVRKSKPATRSASSKR